MYEQPATGANNAKYVAAFSCDGFELYLTKTGLTTDLQLARLFAAREEVTQAACLVPDAMSERLTVRQVKRGLVLVP